MTYIKPLRIVFVDFDDIRNPLLGAGQAKATFEIGKRLVHRGHSVTVISSRYPGYTDRIEHGIRYKHIGLGTNNIRLNNLFYIASIPFAVRNSEADIIVECFTSPISTLLTPLWTNVPVVAKPTSFEADRFAKQYHLPFHVIERYGCLLYTYFLPAMKVHEQKMKKYNARVISRIVPEGVDDVHFTIKRKKPRYILFLGRLDIGQKGIDLLLKAYGKIADEVAYPLVIAGHGPDEQKVRELIKVQKLQHRVTMLGATYGERKLRVLSEALFVALPSRHEGFSIFSLEALAAGLPLVTFAIPELSWQQETIALKAPVFDVDAYARLLKKATEKKVYQPMHAATRAFAKQFTWDSTADQYESFFQTIVSFHPLPVRKKAYASS